MNLSYNSDFIPNYNIFNINNSSIREILVLIIIILNH